MSLARVAESVLRIVDMVENAVNSRRCGIISNIDVLVNYLRIMVNGFGFWFVDPSIAGD